MARKKMFELNVPDNLHEQMGSPERILESLEKGVILSRIGVLQEEVSELTERIDNLRRRNAELPHEIKRMEILLKELIKDQEALAALLCEKR
jgi:polyhydroxyalkanoate synthesis regulator phasin